MKIQVWSDIMCPFCYLGDQNLKNAIKEYTGNDTIEVEYKAFQLNPSQEKSVHPDNPISYTIKKGLDLQLVNASFNHIVNEAKNLGLPIDILNAKVVNSLDALRLIKYAEKFNQSDAIKNDLFRAYFAEGIDLSIEDNLVEIAKKNGLDDKEVVSFLKSDLFISEVNADRNDGISKGLQGVPFFVINDAYTLSGNQPKESLLNAFNQIKSTNSSESCSIDSKNC